MSHVLIVNAHPLTADESNSLKLLERFEQKYRELNPEDTFETIRLFEEAIPEVDADLLRGWTKARAQSEVSDAEADKMQRFSAYTEQFLNADKVVIVNALWNLNIPTRLKAWIDTVNVAGKTFKYTAEGPVPLTSGKKAIHLQSNGGIYGGNDPASQYLKAIMNFVGVEDYAQVFVEGIDYAPDQAETILNEALLRVETAAAEF